jgi:chemotaxis family two-component system response regulator Rcp1
MPGLDGLDLLRWLRSESSVAAVPVIVLTSSGASSHVLAAYNLKANCFIKKPSDLSEFAKVMRQIEMFRFGVATLLPPALRPVCEANTE